MKRSQINRIMAKARGIIRGFGFALPPFADWSAETFDTRRHEARHVIRRRLGRDITDFGSGDFSRLGVLLFTLRNGEPEMEKAGAPAISYCEKLLISRRDQICPMHRHFRKVEDIINRGGATLAIRLHASAPDGALDETAPGTVLCDGIERPHTPGEVLRLRPGESITLFPRTWHAFWAEGGDVLIGEVSGVNDDETDNLFHEPFGRFAQVEEDEAPLHLLVSDYGRLL